MTKSSAAKITTGVQEKPQKEREGHNDHGTVSFLLLPTLGMVVAKNGGMLVVVDTQLFHDDDNDDDKDDAAVAIADDDDDDTLDAEWISFRSMDSIVRFAYG